MLLTPEIFLPHLFLIFGGKIVLDAKGISNLLRRLSTDHVGNSFTGNVKKRLDVQEVGGNNKLEKDGLGNITELLIKSGDGGGEGILLSGLRVLSVVAAVSQNLLKNLGGGGEGDGGFEDGAIFQNVFDGSRHLSNLPLNFEFERVTRLSPALEPNSLFGGHYCVW